MNKRTHDNLGKIFAREVVGSFYQPPRNNSTPKWVQELIDGGLVKPYEEQYGGRFPTVCEGFILTSLGHISYCTSVNDYYPE